MTASALHYNWVPACNGAEVPFEVRGHVLHYMWCPRTREHAYYDVRNDVFLSHKAASRILNPDMHA